MALYPYCLFLVMIGIGMHWSDTTLIFQKNTEGPAPGVKGVANLLFYLERSPDANAICYTVNLGTDGKIKQENPVDVFWFRYNQVPERKDLNLVQRKLAYGVKTRIVSTNEYEVHIVSFPQRILRLKRWEDGPFQIFTSIAGREAILSNVYIKFKSAKAAPPLIDYIDLFGKCSSTGQPQRERIPSKELYAK